MLNSIVLAIFFVVIFLTPFVFVVLTAFMTPQQALTSHLWPHPFVWSNFKKVFELEPFWQYTYNPVVYAVLATIGVVISSVPVAYALARMRWKGRQGVFLLILATMMLPAQVTIVPLYVLFTTLHWIGSLKPLILPTFFGDAFSIFLLRPASVFMLWIRKASAKRFWAYSALVSTPARPWKTTEISAISAGKIDRML